MVAYELTAAIFASVILFSLVLFTIPGYVRAVAMGALDFYGGLHHSIVSFCAPVVITPLSYFSDHLQNRTTRYIAVTVKGGTWKLDVSRIFYAESRGHTIIYHTASGEYVSRGTMKELEDTLEGMHFFRGNNCYLINLEYVAGVVGGCAMVNGERLILSRPRKKAFLEAVARYLGEVVK